MTYHGVPCWFELSTPDVDAGKGFYERLFGWSVGDSQMPDLDYRLAQAGGDRVAGLMALDHLPAGTPPNWCTYICVDDADAAVAKATATGGRVMQPVNEIGGIGRFAVLADLQGAVFGIMQPDVAAQTDEHRAAMEAGGGAFNQEKAGHGNWLELMTPDPKAALAFYSGLFGWTEGEAMPMGENPDGSANSYQLFRHKGTDIGGISGLGQAPLPLWLPYFGVDRAVSDVIAMVKDAGGHIEYGPVEVPGPAWVAGGADPQGAWFAVVGGTA